MIRRLKKSFVTITVLSAALVLAVLLGAINVINYVQRGEADEEILQVLAENGGHFPSSEKGGKHQRRFTEETPYETRYFSVLLRADGSVLTVDTTQIAAVDREDAAAMAQALLAEGKTTGYVDMYRYAAVTPAASGELGASGEPGGVLYVFLDCSRNLSAVREFLITSLIVAAAGLVVLFGLAWLFSGWAIRPIVESYEKQKSFITNAGHELKTPLAVIQSATEVIELENGESQWTQSIHGQVGRLASLTEELIALSRMDEGAAPPVMAETDVSEAAARALEPYAVLAEQKGFGFSADIEPGIRCRTNVESLEKICAILADNAVKYTAPGGAIHFALSLSGGHVRLTEENPAEGLSPGPQERLFDRFYRGDESRGEQPGYGLGLPMARALAEAMGGSLRADNPDGKRLVVTWEM